MSSSAKPDQEPDEVDEASSESFPASDPPSWEPLHFGPPSSRPERERPPRVDRGEDSELQQDA